MTALLDHQRARLDAYAERAGLDLPAIGPEVGPDVVSTLLAWADGADRGLAAVAHRSLQELALADATLLPALGWRAPYRLPVRGVSASGALGVRIDLLVPEEHRPAFAFEAGQHVKVFLDVDGVQVARSYSVCVPPARTRQTGLLSIGVRRLPGGLVSGHLHDGVRPGDTLVVSPPHGSLVATAADDGPVLLVGGGSGVTPLVSIAADQLSRDHAPVGMVVVDRDRAHAMLTAEIDDLRACYRDRFRVRRLWTRTAGAARPDEAALGAVLASVLPAPAVALACGPGGLLATVRSVLRATGLPDEQVRVSAFDTASRNRTAPL